MNTVTSISSFKDELKHWSHEVDEHKKGFLKLEKGHVCFSKEPPPRGFFEFLKRIFGFGNWSLQQIVKEIQRSIMRLEGKEISELQHAVEIFNKEVVDKANKSFLRTLLPFTKIHSIIFPKIVFIYRDIAFKEQKDEKRHPATIEPSSSHDLSLDKKKEIIYQKLDAWYENISGHLWFYERYFINKVLKKIRSKIEGSATLNDLRDVTKRFKEKAEENNRLQKNQPSSDAAKALLGEVPKVIDDFINNYL
jgi:hypothetical protein